MSTTPITIAIFEDSVFAGKFTAEEIRAANPDCPDVEAAIRCLEAGAYRAELRLGAGGVTVLAVVEGLPLRVVGPSDVVEVRARVVKACAAPKAKAPLRFGLASYRGTLAEVRAAAERDVAHTIPLAELATMTGKTEAELVDAVEGRR